MSSLPTDLKWFKLELLCNFRWFLTYKRELSRRSSRPALWAKQVKEGRRFAAIGPRHSLLLPWKWYFRLIYTPNYLQLIKLSTSRQQVMYVVYICRWSYPKWLEGTVISDAKCSPAAQVWIHTKLMEFKQKNLQCLLEDDRASLATSEFARRILAACRFLCHKISLYLSRIERA
jgi:hypothetical protein